MPATLWRRLGWLLASAAVLAAGLALCWPRASAPGPPAPPRRTRPYAPARQHAAPGAAARAADGLSRPHCLQLLSDAYEAQTAAARELQGQPTLESFATLRRSVAAARELVAAAPDTQEALGARYQLSRSLAMLGEATQAEQEFEAYLRQLGAREGPAAVCDRLLDEGRRECRAKRFDVALARFHAVLAHADTGHGAAQARLGIGSVYAAAHAPRRAEAALRQALAVGLPTPEAARCTRYLANRALSLRNYPQARNDIHALLALPTTGPQRATDEARLGIVIERTEGPMAAARFYRQLLDKYPKEGCPLAQGRLNRILAHLEEDVLSVPPGGR